MEASIYKAQVPTIGALPMVQYMLIVAILMDLSLK
jgi:hypothetical protein